MQVLIYSLSGTSDSFWLPIPLETADDKYSLKLEKGTDLKHIYCNRIFHSGKFHNNVIAKTLSVGESLDVKKWNKNINQIISTADVQ